MPLFSAVVAGASISLLALAAVRGSPVENNSPLVETQEVLGPKGHADFEDDDEFEKVEGLRVDAKAGLAYRSNIFEVNEKYDSPIGDWFSDVGLDLATSVRALPEGFSLGLVFFWKQYARQHAADEYLAKGSVRWAGPIAGVGAVSVTAFGGGFQQGQFFQFGRVSAQAQAGWLEGVRLIAKSKLSDTLQLTTEATSEYRLFRAAQDDNLQDTVNVELACHCDHGITAMIAGEVHDSHYRQRPPEDEGVRNPAELDTVEGRALGRVKWAVNQTWTIQGEFGAGPNLDLTNGYYDARVAAAGLEVRYQKDRWEITLVAEPELAQFSRRPANFLQRQRRLTTEEYVFEVQTEYRLSEAIHLYASEAFKTVIANGAQGREDVTVNSFRTNAVSVGLKGSF